MIAAKRDNIVPFPCKIINGDKSAKETIMHKSTRMWCLKDEEEIQALFNTFKNKILNAHTEVKYKIGMRNLTMYVCAINIGLRGGDFCSLKWSDIYDDDWTFKIHAEYVPKKTRKCHKHINLTWSSDLEVVLEKWRDLINPEDINSYIFQSQKGEKLTQKAWYKIVENTRKEAGIDQKIGTHGLRKTMANQYIKNSDDKTRALLEVSTMFGHSDLRITERYACLEDENIKATKQKMAFLC